MLAGGGGTLPYKPIWDVPFLRVSFFSLIPEPDMKIDKKNPKQVMTYLFKNNRLLFFLLFSGNFVIQ